jgi:hypothetical protein
MPSYSGKHSSFRVPADMRWYTKTGLFALVLMLRANSLGQIPLVQHGENVDPILLFFLMLEVFSTLKNTRPYKAPECGHFPSRLWLKSGCFWNQATKTRILLLVLFQIMFVDDIIFIFENEIDTYSANQLIYNHYTIFGLLMNVG